MLTLFVTLVADFSACVEYFPKRSFPPVHPWGCPKKGKNFGQKKSTHTDIFEIFLIGYPKKSRYVLTFSDRFLYYIWCIRGAVSGQKTAFGSDSHAPKKQRLGLRLGSSFPTLKRVPIRKCSMAQMEPSWMRLRPYEEFSDNLDILTRKC